MGRNEESCPNTFGANVCSEPNNFNAFTDLDRDENVDFYDFGLYLRDWLKDSNDPNTWRDFPYDY